MRCLTRNPSHLTAPPGVVIVAGDLRDPATLGAFLARDAVVVNLAFVRDATVDESRALALDLAAACRRAGVRRLVHVSTADVLGASDTDLADESTPCLPRTDYERGKHAIETALLAAADSLELAVLRLAAVFGPGGRNLVAHAQRVASGSPLAQYAAACFHGRRAMNLVSVGTVVAAIDFVANLERPLRAEVVFVSEDDAPANNYRDVEAVLRRAFGRPAPSFPTLCAPAWLQRTVLGAAGRSNTNPLRRVSPAKLRGLGFRAPATFEAALEDYARYLAAQFAREGEVRG
jgi:nucleoside-diphosphate-sugar epimerase